GRIHQARRNCHDARYDGRGSEQRKKTPTSQAGEARREVPASETEGESMNDDILHNYPVWDRLFELLYPCDENLTDQEVDVEINRLGIDMQPAFLRLHKMIEAQRAKAHFAAAKERRATIGERIRDVVAPKLDD